MSGHFNILIPEGWRLLQPEEKIRGGDKFYSDTLERFTGTFRRFSGSVGVPVGETDYIVIRRFEE